MKALGNIIWQGIHSDGLEEQESFQKELEKRSVDPDASIWLHDKNDGWYVSAVGNLPFLGNVSKRLVAEYSWARPQGYDGI